MVWRVCVPEALFVLTNLLEFASRRPVGLDFLEGERVFNIGSASPSPVGVSLFRERRGVLVDLFISGR